MFVVDSEKFLKALKEKGYHSVTEFSRALGLHRNTLHYYLSGHPVLSEQVGKMFDALDLSPQAAIIKREKSPSGSLDEIAPLIDQLQKEFPGVTFVLFGSHATGRAKKYADWDIGIYAKKGIEHELYRAIAIRADDLTEWFPCIVDVVNLARADSRFLQSASKGWRFLSGSLGDWLDLQRKVAA